MKKIFIISGTPGTGKTTYAKKLSKEKKYKYIDVNKVIDENKLSEGYDKKRKTKIVDEKKLAKVLEKMIKEFKTEIRKKGKVKYKGMVIDSHMSHYINPKYVDKCFVTKCDLKELEKRLKKKKYHKAKIEENIQSEIFDICYMEALEKGHVVRVVKRRTRRALAR